MITNKICFIHLRDQQQRTWSGLEDKQTGGVTVPWMVTEGGDIIVGQPARCRDNERFVKALGRAEAKHKFETLPPLFTIPKGRVQELAVCQGMASVALPVLPPKARYSLMASMAALLEANLLDNLSSGWYEQQVRDRLSFKNNDVTYDESVEAIFDANNVAVMNYFNTLGKPKAKAVARS